MTPVLTSVIGLLLTLSPAWSESESPVSKESSQSASDSIRDSIPEKEQIYGEEESVQKRTWKETRQDFQYQNIKVPRQLWDEIEKHISPGLKTGDGVGDLALIPISLTVELLTEDPYVFREKVNHRITYVEGGGTVDFFDYLTGKGEFFVRFSPHLTDDEPFFLLYISDSPGKKVEGQSWGNGCGHIYDLSEGARHFIYDQGIKVTSARRHHMHLLAGTYVFFQRVDERLLLGYIRLTDSRFPQFGCRDETGL